VHTKFFNVIYVTGGADMLRAYFVSILTGAMLLGCMSTQSEPKKANVSLNVQISVSDSLFERLFDSASIKVSANDMPSVNFGCIVVQALQQIICNALVPLGSNRTFELMVYDKDDNLSYYGKAFQDVSAPISQIDILLYRLASSITVHGVITDSTIYASPSFTWVWTQDSRGGGTQSSLTRQGDTVTVDSCYHVHFTELDSTYGAAIYRFKIKSRSFDFSWRITPGNPNSGKGLQIAYNMNVWPNQLKLIKSNWGGGGFYYGWPDQSEELSESIPLVFDPNVWHTIQIEDSGTDLAIYLDGIKMPFFQTYTPQLYLSGLSNGYVGFGTTVSKTRITGMQILRLN
jgi:hypothetical protein